MVSAREVRSGWRYVGAPSASSNRVREDACGMLAPGPSCVCDRCSSNANGSLWPEFGWIPANLCDLSKG